MTREGAVGGMKSCCSINFVGKKAVKLGIKANLVEPHKIIKIKNIPHAQAII